MKTTFTFGNIIGAVAAVLILGVLALPLYFIGRSFFPLESPEFAGLTIWQVMDERAAKAEELSRNYTDSNPAACYQAERIAIVTNGAPTAIFCGVLNASPALSEKIQLGPRLQGMGCGTDQVSWLDAPAAAWQVFEAMLVEYFQEAIHSPVPYCRIGL